MSACIIFFEYVLLNNYYLLGDGYAICDDKEFFFHFVRLCSNKFRYNDILTKCTVTKSRTVFSIKVEVTVSKFRYGLKIIFVYMKQITPKILMH